MKMKWLGRSTSVLLALMFSAAAFGAPDTARAESAAEGDAPELEVRNLLQETPTSAVPVGSDTRLAQGSEASGHSNSSEGSTPSGFVRVLAESGLGLAGGAVGSIVGGLAGGGVVLAASDGHPLAGGLGLVVFGTLTAPAGAGFGVWGGGALADGRGTIPASLLGAYLGALVAVPTVAFIPNAINDARVLYVPALAAAVGGVGGGIAGYEISHAARVDRGTAMGPGTGGDDSLRWLPTVRRQGRSGWSFGVRLQLE